MVRHARLHQPGRDVLQHHPHRRIGRTEQAHLGFVIRPGLACGNKDVSATRATSRPRSRSSWRDHAVEERPGLGPAVLGAVAEGEQRLGAAGFVPRPGHGHHLIRLEVDATRAGRLGEGAVGAAIPAEGGERDEDLAAVGDGPPLPFVAERPGVGEQSAVVEVAFQIAKGQIGIGCRMGQCRTRLLLRLCPTRTLRSFPRRPEG